MKNYEVGSLKIEVQEVDERVTMTWLGESDAREPSETLSPFLASLLKELSGKEILINYQQLAYMNSSTVPPIIHFIKNLDSDGIKTLIVYDAASKWQSASFKALETLSTVMPNITVKGE